MLRPCFLIVDREHAASISSRKLVIETAKFNVITAYSGAEALQALRKFPNVDGVVMDAATQDISCAELIRRLRQVRDDLQIVVVGDAEKYACEGATHHIESFVPKQILTFLQKLYPEFTDDIVARDRQLDEEERATS